MSYFKRRPAAMGWIPGPIMQTAGAQPLPPPEPAYGTKPGGSGESPPIIQSGIETIKDLFGLSTPAQPTSSPYVPPPGQSSSGIFGLPTPLVIGAAALGAFILWKKK